VNNIEEAVPMQKERRKGKKHLMKRLFGIIITLLLFALAALGLGHYGKVRFPWEPESVAAINVGASIQKGTPGMTSEEQEAALQAGADISSISFELNFRPVFENGQATGSLWFVNPPKNHYDMRVEIRLNSDERLLYDTGLMPRNSYIDGDKLFISLPKGEYGATAHLLAFEPEDSEKNINRATAEVIITIKN
jgi:hypothetical protein